jgi:hypothetical protein
MDKSQNVHTYVRTDNLFVDYKDLNDKGVKISSKIEPKDLYEKKVNVIWGFFFWLFTGITKQYIAILDAKGKVISETEPEVSARVLKVSKDWKGLDQAIRSAFMKNFELPDNIVPILLGLIVVVFLILIITGRINLSQITGVIGR